MPDGPATGTLFLLSSAAGWGEAEVTLAARLQHANAEVVGIDLPTYLAALDAPGKDCVYLVADFVRIGHAIERAPGGATFHAPLVAGLGEGGALAIDILSQTPADTLGGAVAANPTAGQGLGETADWEITVSGWLGSASSAATPITDPLRALPPGLLPCVYGEEETDSACPSLADSGATLMRTRGCHHFDGNCPALADAILRALPDTPAAQP